MHNFYPETSKAFQEIIRNDPDCGIAYWGFATSYRPNLLVPPFPVAIFYALSLLETIDLSDKTYGNQLKAAGILNAQAKDHPKHPGIAHYLIHSYDFAPLAAMCLDTARLYAKIAANSSHALQCRPTSIRCSACGMTRSGRTSEALTNGYAAKAYPGVTDAQVPHNLDFLMYTYGTAASGAKQTSRILSKRQDIPSRDWSQIHPVGD